MARVKITPTPRNTALNEAMRRAAAKVNSPASVLPLDLPRALPLPTPLPSLRRPTVKATKSSTNIIQTSKGSEVERSSSEPLKRKSDSNDHPERASKKAATSKLTLRSAAKSTPAADGEVTAKDTPVSKSLSSRDSITPLRRSARASKVVSASESLSNHSAPIVPSKPTRASKTQKKIPRDDSSQVGANEEHQHAVQLRQQYDSNQASPDASPEHVIASIEHVPAARSRRTSTRTSTRAKPSRAGSTSTPASAIEDLDASKDHDIVPLAVSDTQLTGHLQKARSVVQSAAMLYPASVLLDIHHAIGANEPFFLQSSIGLPFSKDSTPAVKGQESSLQATYTYPDPSDAAAQYHEPLRMHLDDSQTYTAAGHVVGDRSSNASRDSGYATSQPPPGPESYSDGMHTLSPGYSGLTMPGTPERQVHSSTTSTKGQKVKGRPTPKNPKVRDTTSRSGRNIANTYPRKQPFKAQIEYPSYPPADTTVPADYTLWEICQNFPNSLREENLLPFVQREWSANELCACLKDDARNILNARPGKDKTMVYQKRLERIKKDLIAKNEYNKLVNGPMMREDGRPSWVKRGNVRRK
jgi:hypothetical protein